VREWEKKEGERDFFKKYRTRGRQKVTDRERERSEREEREGRERRGG